MPRELADRETVITFNPVDKTASIWTYDRSWQRHIEGKLGIKPNVINGQTENGGGRDDTAPQSSIHMPKAPKKLSENARKEIGERLAKARGKSVKRGKVKPANSSVHRPLVRAKPVVRRGGVAVIPSGNARNHRKSNVTK